MQDEAFVTAPPKAANAKNHLHPTPGRIYALDCKIVENTAGRVPARFTLLQTTEYIPSQKSITCTVVWDTLVQPDAKVTDYLTQWSGVSAQSLQQGPIVTLAQMQAARYFGWKFVGK